MKILLKIIICLIGLNGMSFERQSNCTTFENALNKPYDCGGDGQPILKEDKTKCEYTCFVNGQYKTCQEVHPLNSTKFENSKCKKFVFDCNGMGEPTIGDNCDFSCVQGKTKKKCPDVYPLSYYTAKENVTGPPP
ncbi:hypothetical protein RN001_009919 [Aquatica leii]|uniref:Secreted salivary protein n=1 Tax=Aquatica leii TaxID=1421715 RepID=A0AAN7QH49_9COLE|nr:hypothetical protein RN001_009919 [Aquatica leii]